MGGDWCRVAKGFPLETGVLAGVCCLPSGHVRFLPSSSPSVPWALCPCAEPLGGDVSMAPRERAPLGPSLCGEVGEPWLLWTLP